MSNISNRGEQSTSTEIEALTNLTALEVSGPGEFIRKVGTNTFENATPAGSGSTTVITISFNIEIPPEAVDGVTTDFTVLHQPKVVVADGLVRRQNKGYTYSGGVISVDPLTPPQYDIFIIY